ncbi:MAG: PorV/PorQ family protein [candidate division WOR-3 bacterium]|nr:PorV/PorQ family protein [candidate division WOR-3 bacterium]
MRTTFVFLLVFITVGQSYSQYVRNVSGVGTTAAPFLEIEIGSRAIGMGGAFVAVADDATAIYWNPAGLSRLQKNEITVTHIEWLADINFDFAGGIFYLGNYGVIGVSLTSLSTTDMEVRTVDDPEGTGEMFSVGSMALGLSYAKNLTDKFSMGFNTKYIQEKIWHMSTSSFAIDFGTLFITPFNDIKIGMNISNFGTDMMLSGRDVMVYHDIDPTIMGNNELIEANLVTDNWPLPLIFRAGIAMDILESRNNRLTVAVDAVHPNDNTEYVNLGMEYVCNNIFSLRGGYSSLFKRDSEEGLTFGAGIQSSIGQAVLLKVDYAYTNFSRLGNTHRISLGMDF